MEAINWIGESLRPKRPSEIAKSISRGKQSAERIAPPESTKTPGIFSASLSQGGGFSCSWNAYAHAANVWLFAVLSPVVFYEIDR